MIRGSHEWLLEGPTVIEAPGCLDGLSDRVVQTISTIRSAMGELSMKQSRELIALVEKTVPQAEEVRAVLYK